MEKITMYINKTQRAINYHRSKAFEKYGLAGNQVSYLIAIYHNPGVSQEAIAKWQYCNKSTVTRNLNPLIDLGFIERVVDEKDKRAYSLFPTKKLIDTFPEIKLYLENYNKELLSDLDDMEREIFVKALIKVSNKALESVKEE